MRRLLFLSLLLVAAAAQQPPADSSAFGSGSFSRAASTAITVFITAFFLAIFFCLYLNQCRGAVQDPTVADGRPPPVARPDERRRGLPRKVLESLPIVVYREVKAHWLGKGELECAVCLTEFDDGDSLRLLSPCSHAFHPECIDPWLGSHSTCPLCRASIRPPAPPKQPSPRQQPPPPAQTTERAVAIDIERDEELELAIELERLRLARRAARFRSHSTGHSLQMRAEPLPAPTAMDHERFTLRLPEHVRRDILSTRRLRHSTSLVSLSVLAGEGSSRGERRGASIRLGQSARWPSFLTRTLSWARGGGGDGSVKGRRDGEGSMSG